MQRILSTKTYKRTFAILIVLLLSLTFLYHDWGNSYAGSSNQYLVLVQQKNGTWKSYKNLIEKSSGGSLMVKAKPISKALGLSYKKTGNGFLIKRSSTRYLTFTKNSKEYTYSSGNTHTVKAAPESAYTSKISSYNLCQVSTLSNLVHYKYFDRPKEEGYESYQGIICYSKYDEIPGTVPGKELIPTKTPTPTPVPEPAAIIIEGVEFPVRDSFLTLKEAKSDWGGAAVYLKQLEKELDQKILPTTDLVITSDQIGFSHQFAGGEGVYLTKASKGYKLAINVKLSGSVLSAQNAEVLKAMAATISSKPTLVYTAIYESFTSENTHGIKEDTYTVIGDCKIKVVIKDGIVTYYILEA
jgi:hypothetical protein